MFKAGKVVELELLWATLIPWDVHPEEGGSEVVIIVVGSLVCLEGPATVIK